MLLPICLLLSTLIYKKQHFFATDSHVSSVFNSKLINLALRAYLRADFKAKMAKMAKI